MSNLEFILTTTMCVGVLVMWACREKERPRFQWHDLLLIPCAVWILIALCVLVLA